MAEDLDVRPIDVRAIEEFVGGNIEEMAEYGRQALDATLLALLETYNARVAAVETDLSLLIEIPKNLR